MWLKVTSYHAQTELHTMFSPSFEDFCPLVMHGEVVQDNFVSDKMIDVDFLSQDLAHNCLHLSTVEWFKHLLGI